MNFLKINFNRLQNYKRVKAAAVFIAQFIKISMFYCSIYLSINQFFFNIVFIDNGCYNKLRKTIRNTYLFFRESRFIWEYSFILYSNAIYIMTDIP